MGGEQCEGDWMSEVKVRPNRRSGSVISLFPNDGACLSNGLFASRFCSQHSGAVGGSFFPGTPEESSSSFPETS